MFMKKLTYTDSPLRFEFPGVLSTCLIALLFILFSAGDAKAFIDDIWQEYTPGKNIIGYNEDARGIYLHYQSRELQQLKEWYFYKAHIVGTLRTAEGENYFIFNERNNQLEVFDHREAFESRIRRQQLRPVFKRVYSYKWSLFPKESSLNYVTAFIFLVYASIPFLLFQLLVFGIICVIMFIRGRFVSFICSLYELTVSIAKAVLWVSLFAVPIVLICWYLKGAFPQSI